MGPTPDDMTEPWAERWWWQAARRDDSRVARRLSRRPRVDGGYRRDDGAWRDEVFPCLQALGVMAWLEPVPGAAIQREMGLFVQSVRRDGLKPLGGSNRLPAWPQRLFRAAAVRRLVGFQAQPGRHGLGQRGATTRQGERPPGPVCPDTLARHLVTWQVWDLEAVCQGAIRALATAGIWGQQVTGMAAGTALETTARARGGGQGTRNRRLEAQQGRGHARAVTVSGWKGRLVRAAATTMPLAVKVVTMHQPETLCRPAVVTQARAHLAGDARRHQGVFDNGLVAGGARGWRQQRGLLGVVAAHDHLAVTVDARAPAAAGEGLTGGRRGHPVRCHGGAAREALC